MYISSGVALIMVALLAVHFFIPTVAEGDDDSSWRIRRKVGKYRGPGPVEYMKQLRDKFSTPDGVPTDLDTNPTSIWCLFDQDVANKVYHKKAPNNKCQLKQSFKFNITQLVEANPAINESSFLPLSEALLRTYVQPIKQHFKGRNKTSLSLQVSIYTRITSSTNGSSCSGSSLALKDDLEISTDTKDHWIEWNITQGVSTCWQNKMENGDTLEATVIFKLDDDSCVSGHKKVPMRIVDPAIIPVNQKTRRARYWDLQPIVIFFLDNEKERAELKSSVTGNQNNVGEKLEIPDKTDSRGKRSTNNICKVHPLRVKFADIGLNSTIYVPAEYNAGQCLGSCDIAMQHLSPFTNHGRILASLYYTYVNSKSYPGTKPHAPCCVASQYQPLSVLLLTKTGLMQAPYARMKVAKCECRN